MASTAHVQKAARIMTPPVGLADRVAGVGKQHNRAAPSRYTHVFLRIRQRTFELLAGLGPAPRAGGDSGPKTFYIAEAAMQASKVELAGDIKAEQALYRAETGFLAKKIGRGISLSSEQVQQWDAIKFEVVKEIA